MTRAQNIDALAVAIRRLIEVLVAGNQIGSHQNLTDAQAGLRDALRAVLLKERADD